MMFLTPRHAIGALALVLAAQAPAPAARAQPQPARLPAALILQ
jgi:hypothetical protein